MYIYDEKNDKVINSASLFLTVDEAKVMRGYLDQLIKKYPSDEHTHVSNDDYQKEITLMLYESGNTSAEGLHEKTKEILKDELNDD